MVSCSPPPEVPSDQLMDVQGVTYWINTTKPFTGIKVYDYSLIGDPTVYKQEYKDGVLQD